MEPRSLLMRLPETDQERALARVLWLLREYLADLVLIGGWVPHLYRQYGGDPWTGRLSRTAEVDVLATPPLQVRDGISLEETLHVAGLEPSRGTEPAAVWQATTGSGELIEFLTPLKGTALDLGSTVRMAGHGRVGAIMLPGLELLARHTATLAVPVGDVEGRFQNAAVRVPRLGVYIVNKAVTALARSPHVTGPNPKQAKDLVYIHDGMAAGAVVRQRVEDDIHALWASAVKTSIERRTILAATTGVRLVLSGSMGLVPLAGEELGTRDQLSGIEAVARIRGQLTDLLDLLQDAQKTRKRSPPGSPSI